MLDVNIEYTISEAAEITGYPPHVLRYYEKEFEINIPRKDSNHRYYTYKEIELIQYIKGLKDQGFSNKQIKLIINSPETILGMSLENEIDIIPEVENIIDTELISMQISEALSENFFNKLSNILSAEREDTEILIEDLKKEILGLRNEIHSKERDVLISENAKLKMKVKEKTYENVKLKEELLRLNSKKRGIFKRIFRIER